MSISHTLYIKTIHMDFTYSIPNLIPLMTRYNQRTDRPSLALLSFLFSTGFTPTCLGCQLTSLISLCHQFINSFLLLHFQNDLNFLSQVTTMHTSNLHALICTMQVCMHMSQEIIYFFEQCSDMLSSAQCKCVCLC